MFHGKKKAITFSYDDGITQDIKLIEILNKHGLKATFNLNSGLFGSVSTRTHEAVTVSCNRLLPEDVKYVYEGHEVASHTINHFNLTELPDEEIIRQVEGDRLKLSELCGYEVVGMAYPCGGVNHDERTERVIRSCTGIQYCRLVESSYSFAVPENRYCFHPTLFHMDMDHLFQMTRDFLDADPEEPMLFYLWGHGYEFDFENRYQWFDEYCSMIAGHSDIFYGTNREVLL